MVVDVLTEEQDIGRIALPREISNERGQKGSSDA